MEVSASLNPARLAATMDDADNDLRWAVAVAAFAEILKDSPYADPSSLDTIRSIVRVQRGIDADRREFAALMDAAMALPGMSQ